MVRAEMVHEFEFGIGDKCVLDTTEDEYQPKVHTVASHVLIHLKDADGATRLFAECDVDTADPYGPGIKRYRVSAGRLRPVPAKKAG
jgi:hypothetical protein